MIGRLPHTEEPGRLVFVPLVSRVPGVWTRLDLSGAGCPDQASATRICVHELAVRYEQIIEQSRILTALCEHEDVTFIGSIVDADTLRLHARQLHSLICAQQDNVPRLLDDAGPDDTILFGALYFRVNEDGLLTLQDQQIHRGYQHLRFRDIDEDCFAAMREVMTIESEERIEAEATLVALCINAPLDVLATMAASRPDMLSQVAAAMAQFGTDVTGLRLIVDDQRPVPIETSATGAEDER